MNDELSLFLVKKFEDDIKNLHSKLHDIDKLVTLLEHRILSINDRLDREEKELDKLQAHKFSNFFAKHWTKLPQLFVVVGGFLWFANWLYDLPSPKQEAEIKRLTEEKIARIP